MDGITVNGAPLKEYIDREVGAEIGKVRLSNERLKVRTASVSRHTRSVSGARTLPGRSVYESGQKATHVLVRGELFPWMEKAPYVLSGESILGAVEYCESTQEFKCHECGQWCRSLGNHMRGTHRDLTKHCALSLREYKIRHGFSVNSGLVRPDQSKARRDSGVGRRNLRGMSGDFSVRIKAQARVRSMRSELGNGYSGKSPEMANLLNRCMAQREKLLTKFYRELGHSPSGEELRSFIASDGSKPLAPVSLRTLFKVPISKLFIRLGIPPNKRGRHNARYVQMKEQKIQYYSPDMQTSWMG